MGSLNDYGRRWTKERPAQQTGGLKRRLILQSALAAVLFFAVAGFVSADHLLGQGARYVAGEALRAESSWVDFDTVSAAPVLADRAEESTAGAADPAAESTPATPAEDAVPQFTAPASGIVVTDLAVEVSGFASQQGILIQGGAGQSVKAAADGIVQTCSTDADGTWQVELLHSGGFRSLYRGLSAVTVEQNQQVEIGTVLGETASGEVGFSLLQGEEALNPLDYLFR